MKNLKTPDVTADLRPKGRGRPQRILLGQWPEEHVREVIRAVVFREVRGQQLELYNATYHISQCPKKAPTRALSLLKAPTSAFTKNLLKTLRDGRLFCKDHN